MWQKYNKPLLVMCPSVWESEFSVIGWLCSSHTNAEQVSTQKVFVQGLAWPGLPIPSLLLKLPRSTLAACWVQLQVSVSRLWPIIATYPFPPTLRACLWAYEQALSCQSPPCMPTTTLALSSPQSSAQIHSQKAWDYTAHSAACKHTLLTCPQQLGLIR